MDRIFNCLVFKHRLVITKGEAKLDTDCRTFICNAKSEAEAIESALENVNSSSDSADGFDVEVFALEFSEPTITKLLNAKEKFITALQKVGGVEGSPVPVWQPDYPIEAELVM